MILIGIGGNQESARFGPPRDTLTAALSALKENRIRILTRSSWYLTEPVPPSDQPWFHTKFVDSMTEMIHAVAAWFCAVPHAIPVV